jgi:hypothetical protein
MKHTSYEVPHYVVFFSSLPPNFLLYEEARPYMTTGISIVSEKYIIICWLITTLVPSDLLYCLCI